MERQVESVRWANVSRPSSANLVSSLWRSSSWWLWSWWPWWPWWPWWSIPSPSKHLQGEFSNSHIVHLSLDSRFLWLGSCASPWSLKHHRPYHQHPFIDQWSIIMKSFIMIHHHLHCNQFFGVLVDLFQCNLEIQLLCFDCYWFLLLLLQILVVVVFGDQFSFVVAPNEVEPTRWPLIRCTLYIALLIFLHITDRGGVSDLTPSIKGIFFSWWHNS